MSNATRKKGRAEDELKERIKDQIKHYEQEMTSAMESGEEGRVQQVYADFDDQVGKQVEKLAQTAKPPLKKALLSFFETPEPASKAKK